MEEKIFTIQPGSGDKLSIALYPFGVDPLKVGLLQISRDGNTVAFTEKELPKVIEALKAIRAEIEANK